MHAKYIAIISMYVCMYVCMYVFIYLCTCSSYEALTATQLMRINAAKYTLGVPVCYITSDKDLIYCPFDSV